MDMNNCVEFVALTKEEVEEMIAKAALAGASVAAETLEKAHQKEHSEKSTEEVIEDLMSIRASDGVIVNSIKQSAERTGIIISHVDRMLDVYRMYCGKFGEKEKRQYKVIKSMYITKEKASVADLAKKFNVSKVTIYDDIKTAEERLSALFFGINGLRFY